ncbi:AI-2E family transporter [Cohnella thailandensis]|uniref:AI-2E family transporter n=1 Tax=Cohnella thailandensis TaxID=557557 RepID=A0A841SZM3_9BACL|nr:AI-2E family transporter [Cohnella thailandensis]MBP1976683.1 putative PurR-regulated permease PerM [Cohnella thailandensis]
MIHIPQGKYFRIGYGIIVVLLIFFLASKVDFLFEPFWKMIKGLLTPLLLSLVFYYLLRPPVNYLEKYLRNRTLSISAVFLILAGVLVLIGFLIGPVIGDQVNSLVVNLPELIKLGQDQVETLQKNDWVANYLQEHQVDLSAKTEEIINRVVNNMGDAFNSVMSFVSSFFLLLSTVPFIVYYMLKGDRQFPNLFLKLVPDKHDDRAYAIMKEMDGALSAYIQGKILVSFGLCLLTWIGYSVIGLPYSLLLAVVLTLMNFIPYVGAIIGMVPAVIVGFIESPMQVVWVILVVLIVQQIEDKVLSPQIMGKKLAIHPLTLIIVLLAVGSIGGLFGMFVAVPCYALLKIVVTHAWRLYRLRNIDIIDP